MVKSPPANAVVELSPSVDSCGCGLGPSPVRDEDLREPLVRRQGSHVSMHVARRSAGVKGESGLWFCRYKGETSSLYSSNGPFKSPAITEHSQLLRLFIITVVCQQDSHKFTENTQV